MKKRTPQKIRKNEIEVIFNGLSAVFQNSLSQNKIFFLKIPQAGVGPTRGQKRTLDSSRRDVPVCVAFLQGVLSVPVGCLVKCSTRPTQGRPPPSRGPLFFPVTPHSPTRDMGLFSPKCAPNLVTFVGKNWALAGNGSLAERILRPCVGREEHWHGEYTLQKGHTDRHIAPRAV